VFERLSDHGRFGSADELEAFVAPAGRVYVPLSSRAPRFPELLHDLLTEAMERPPTVGVVELWSRDEQYVALRWASGEILAAGGVDVPRFAERPAFIEQGAGTA